MTFKRYFKKDLTKIYVGDFETFTHQSEYYKNNGYSNIYLISSQKVPIFKSSNLATFKKMDLTNSNKKYDYETKIFINCFDWFNWLVKQERKQIHYFHNFTKFDFFYLLNFLIYESNWASKTKKEIDNIIGLNVKKQENQGNFFYFVDGGTKFRLIKVYLWNEIKNYYIEIEFRDSLKLFNGSIQKLSEQLKQYGIAIDDKVLDFNPHEVQDFFKSKYEIPKVIYERVRTDSTILSKVIETYFTKEGFLSKGSTIKHTIPAIALSNFLSLIIEENKVSKQEKKDYFFKYFEIENKEKRELLNDYFLMKNNFYYGGISSFYHLLKNQWLTGNFNSYDINSMYPAQMIKDLPYGIGVFKKKLTKKDNDKFIFVELIGKNIQQLITNIPALLNRKWLSNKDKALLEDDEEHFEYEFKDEFINFCVTKEEADLYLNSNYFKSDLQIKQYIVFKKKKSIKSFIEKYYSLKQNATNFFDKSIAKLNLNSLYGKFCEKPEHINKVPKTLFENKYLADIEDSFVLPTRESNYNISICSYHYSNHTYAPVGCAITSLARSFLINTFITLCKNDKQKIIYYCDTDSMKCNFEIENKNLIHPNKLGLWKYEGTINYFKYIRAKVYCGVKNKNEWEKGDWLVTAGLNVKKVSETYKPYEFDENLSIFTTLIKRDKHYNPLIFDTEKFISKLI